MIKSKTVLLFMALFCVCLVGPVLSVNAATLTFELNTAFPGKPEPAGDDPWLTAFFDDGGSPGSVYLTMSADLEGTNFVSDWYFNLNPALDPTLLTFSLQGTPTAPVPLGIYTGVNAFKADGDGYFDILFGFPTSASNRFNNSDMITYLIQSSQPILASSFNFLSIESGGEGSWYTAAHIQGLACDDSTWIGVVPVPPSIFLLGSGLIGVVGLGRRRIFG